MRHPTKLEMLLMLVTMTASLAAVAWEQMTPAQREMAVIGWRVKAKRMLGWLARTAAARAMTHELSGNHDAAGAGYSLAYRLSQLRDRV